MDLIDYSSNILFLKVKKFFQYRFIKRLLYSLKNELRLKILKILNNNENIGVHDLKGLIIKEPYSSANFEKYYLLPLYNSRLISISNKGVLITDLGKEIFKYIVKNKIPSIFQKSQKCYEETLVLEVGKSDGKTIKELQKYIPYNCLMRAISRLKPYLDIDRKQSYRKILLNNELKKCNNTDKKIIDLLSRFRSLAVNEIVSQLNLHPRTVYKSFKKLEFMNIITRDKPHKIYNLNTQGKELFNFLDHIIELLDIGLRKDIVIALGIINCLLDRNYPVSEREIFEKCLKSHDKEKIVLSVEEFNRIKNDLKSFGLIIGNVYMGYTPVKELIDLVKVK